MSNSPKQTTDTSRGDLSGFETFDTKGNKSLEKASSTLQKLSDLLHENGGSLGVPMIVGLHGAPGLGKSHLISAFETSIQNIPGVKIHKPHKKFGFSQHQDRYRDASIIINDDLFQDFQSLDDVFAIDAFLKKIQEAEVRHLGEFIFDLYDGKKIWIVSSNFDIKEVLKRVGDMDSQDRLKSRIAHLLATTGVLQLEGDDHRKVLANTGTKFSKLFD